MDIKISDIKESNNFLNILLNKINSAIILVDRELKIYHVNNVFGTLFNKERHRVINKVFGDALECISTEIDNNSCGSTKYCPECIMRDSILKSFKSKKETGKNLFIQEFKINNYNIKKTFEFTSKFLKFNDNDLVLVVLNDITEHEEQKLKLEKLNQEKNKFLGIAAHDLRSHISIIQLYSEFILDRLSKNLNNEQLKFVNQIYDTSFSMLHLLEDILDITKIERGIIEVNRQKLNYVDFVQKIIKLNSIIADKKAININLSTKLNKIDAMFDENKMMQVLNNLLSNAIKYSEKNTEINVVIKKEKNKILTEIIDQGQGIPEHEMEKIFKPFQKISTKPTAGESSTGLGLAIVKKIIKAHNGTIGVKSRVGKGSNFHFYIPIN